MKTKIYMCMFTFLLSANFVFAQQQNDIEREEFNIAEKYYDDSCEPCKDSNSITNYLDEIESKDLTTGDHIRIVCQKKINDPEVNIVCSPVKPDNGWGTIVPNGNNTGYIYKRELHSQGANINSIAFTNPSNGWAVGRMENSSINSGVIFYTDNGGTTWDLQYKSGTPVILHSIVFSDAKNGRIIGVRNIGSLSFDIILETADGGKTWIEESLALRSD